MPTGTLGFRTSGGWWHATRIISERREGTAFLATLATTDPVGRTLAVRIAPDAEGVISLRATVAQPTADVTAVGIAFGARGGERYLGFGERANGVDQRGNEVENYVADGPYQPEERPFVAPFIPSAGYRARDDATYFPMPWLLSTAGYGVLVDNAETSYFRLGTEAADAWSLEANASRLALRVFAGPRPADVLRRLSARIGRQPNASAPWVFGPWWQPRGDDAELVDRLRRADAPASVAQTYTHYLPCGAQQGRREQERTRVRSFHSAGYAVTTYFNPMLCTNYQPVYDRAVAQGVLTKDQLGRPYEYRYGTDVDETFAVTQFDFSATRAPAFYRSLLGEAVADGHDGTMEDFGEYTPVDSRSANGMTGAQMHNLYPVLYHDAAWDFARAQRRPFVRFVRSGWTASAASSQVVWGGDPTSGWDFDGLASAVKSGLGMGLSGVGLWGSDIGGYFELGQNALTPELLIRWIQFGAASGVMRTEAGGVDIPPKPNRPQIWDPDILSHWRRWAKLRTQLYPYLSAAMAEYRSSGLPLMRHLALSNPGDARAVAREDEYMLGADLLVAPVLAPGARRRDVYLPSGRWVDLWRSLSYLPRSGGLAMKRARRILGPRTVSLPAPLAEMPLLARAGALIPLLASDVDTLTGYGSARGLVHLGDRLDRLVLLAFPRGRSAARAFAGDRFGSAEGRRRWVLTVRGTRTRRYVVQASLRTLTAPFRPCRATLDGKPLASSAWRYDVPTGVVHTSFTARNARLEVTGAPCVR